METLFTAFLSSSSGMGESFSGKNECPKVDSMDVFGKFFFERGSFFEHKKSSLKIFGMKVFKKF